MQHVPEETADRLNEDSYQHKTGIDPRDLAASEVGEAGVEAEVAQNVDRPASQTRSAAETTEVARRRMQDEHTGGQG